MDTHFKMMLLSMENGVSVDRIQSKLLINGIKMILGIQIPGIESEQTDALNVLENALEVLLDNLDVNTFNRYKGSGIFGKVEFYKKSYEIDQMYPNWLEGTTTDSGKHSTQVTKTVGTYNKVGEWIENNIGKDVAILDASSGMGLGTQSLREQGFNIEDVEPYQSADRKQNNPATYSSYEDINKQYDFIISNAVLNVIPDDWRTNVLHDMANRLKDGGRMFINTRKAGEEKSIKDKIELDSPQEVLVKRNGKIASYQRFFTPQELKSWIEQELGDGYTVEVANEKNSGTKGLAAVVVTKNNESLTNKGKASELGQPTKHSAPLANVSAKVANYINKANDVISLINNKNGLGPHEFLHELVNIFTKTESTDYSKYFEISDNIDLRLSDHYSNAETFKGHKNKDENFGIVIKISKGKFKTSEGVNYLEYIFPSISVR